MEKFELNFHFGNDTHIAVTVDGENPKAVLTYVTSHNEWFYPNDKYLAIDMRKVSYISVGVPKKDKPKAKAVQSLY